MRVALLVVAMVVPCLSQQAGPPTSLSAVRTLYIEKMPNDLDQYIRAEIVKQLKGRLTVVLRPEEADAIMTGTSEQRTGVGSTVTGRLLGLHDTAAGAVSIVDKQRQTVLWSTEAGDRSLFWGALARGGQRKVASRIVKRLKKALETP